MKYILIVFLIVIVHCHTIKAQDSIQKSFLMISIEKSNFTFIPNKNYKDLINKFQIPILKGKGIIEYKNLEPNSLFTLGKEVISDSISNNLLINIFLEEKSKFNEEDYKKITFDFQPDYCQKYLDNFCIIYSLVDTNFRVKYDCIMGYNQFYWIITNVLKKFKEQNNNQNIILQLQLFLDEIIEFQNRVDERDKDLLPKFIKNIETK